MADDGDPISLDISTTNLAKIDTYLSHLATGNKIDNPFLSFASF